MPSISFQRGFLDALLSGDKMQTTRRQTDRIKAGDVCNIYIEQRNAIKNKPLRLLTRIGIVAIYKRGYPMIPEFHRAQYHAHFLGKVEITKVYDICPSGMLVDDLTMWAVGDGFDTFIDAHKWFTKRYGDDWMDQIWTVIRWSDWLERYFETEAI